MIVRKQVRPHFSFSYPRCSPLASTFKTITKIWQCLTTPMTTNSIQHHPSFLASITTTLPAKAPCCSLWSVPSMAPSVILGSCVSDPVGLVADTLPAHVLSPLQAYGKGYCTSLHPEVTRHRPRTCERRRYHFSSLGSALHVSFLVLEYREAWIYMEVHSRYNGNYKKNKWIQNCLSKPYF